MKSHTLWTFFGTHSQERWPIGWPFTKAKLELGSKNKENLPFQKLDKVLRATRTFDTPSLKKRLVH
jgi:hypothetical protein